MTINAGPGNDRVPIEDVNGASGILLAVNGENGGDTIDASGADLGDVRLLVQGGDGNDVITGSDFLPGRNWLILGKPEKSGFAASSVNTPNTAPPRISRVFIGEY